MIAEYKLYHGAVLAEIVDNVGGPVSIRSCSGSGRLFCYVLDERVGVQVKHATQRLHPWHFSFPVAHIQALEELRSQYVNTYLVLVCRMDGMIALNADEILPILTDGEFDQAWLRADRKKREMYRLYGPKGQLKTKFKTTIAPIADALR